MQKLWVVDALYSWYLLTDEQVKKAIRHENNMYSINISFRIRKLNGRVLEDFGSCEIRNDHDAFRYESDIQIDISWKNYDSMRPFSEEKDQAFLREAIIFMWRTSEWAPLW